eukprot:GHVU01204551.1.p3 GENE.GHVU01204551.1~~GHVU01204551.1.p3  ORF type:complete len:113 (-),score=3.22 GHVU01204551.1:109-447(-)
METSGTRGSGRTAALTVSVFAGQFDAHTAPPRPPSLLNPPRAPNLHTETHTLTDAHPHTYTLVGGVFRVNPRCHRCGVRVGGWAEVMLDSMPLPAAHPIPLLSVTAIGMRGG